MFGSSIIRGLSLSGVALLALAAMGNSAYAGGNHGEPPPVYEQDYSGPPIIRNIPGLRILFSDRTGGENPSDKKKQKIDETYYEPQPVPSGKPKAVKPPPAKATAPATTKTTTNPALPQKTAATAPAAPLAEGPLSCEKATEVVSGFGFSSVEASICAGKFYAFNAKRGGKNFAIKLDPSSGQLTEVKKLP